MPPTLAAAVGQGFRAALREAWLVPVGAVVAAARRLALWPALGVLALVTVRAALAGAGSAPLDPTGPLRGALVALGSRRVDALVLGLAAAGLLLSAALRVAWLSGALPTLGGALAGGARAPRFAAGIAYGLPRVLAAALLGLLAEAGGWGFGAVLATAAVRVAGAARGVGPGGATLAAAACALALTLAVAAPLAAGTLADAAIARAAVRGEGPGRALAGAARRLLARPASFALAAIAFALLAAVVPLSIEGAGAAVLGFARGVPPSVLAGPDLMLAALAVGASAAVDVWALATVASLACGGTAD